jgi:hypothetical protein
MPDPAPPAPTDYGAANSDGDRHDPATISSPGGEERQPQPSPSPAPPVGPGSGTAPVVRGSWPTEAGRGSTPAGDATSANEGLGFPTVNAPAPTERSAPRRGPAAIPRPPVARAADHRGGRRRQVEVVRGRRSRRIVRRVDTWTVLKVSVVFYLCALLVVVVATVLLWYIASAFGTIHDIEKSVRTLFDYSTYTLHPGAVFLYTALGGLVLTVFGTLVNVLVAMLYNLISDVVGGLQIIVLADDEQLPQG